MGGWKELGEPKIVEDEILTEGRGMGGTDTRVSGELARSHTLRMGDGGHIT
jgi:hypothetical protein